uniref:Uncharacterized protein n=1 Tax=Glossina brevipalpis TaxID=37001 RepID=A0A1A9WL04_9MUSC
MGKISKCSNINSILDELTPNNSKNQEAPSKTNKQEDRKIHSRNPFFHYLNAYRKTVHNPSRSIWSITAEAAKHWGEMTVNEKSVYIKKARRAGCMYYLHDPLVRRVLGHLRRALADDSKLDVSEMIATAQLMQRWKKETLMEVLESDKKSKNIEPH